MDSNIHIDYVPNKILYLVIRDDEGRVRLNQKIGVFVPWKDKDIAKYQFYFEYMGGDRYVCTIPVEVPTLAIPKPQQFKPPRIQIFIQKGRDPDEYDELLTSTTMLKVRDYPSKHKGFIPVPQIS